MREEYVFQAMDARCELEKIYNCSGLLRLYRSDRSLFLTNVNTLTEEQYDVLMKNIDNAYKYYKEIRDKFKNSYPLPNDVDELLSISYVLFEKKIKGDKPFYSPRRKMEQTSKVSNRIVEIRNLYTECVDTFNKNGISLRDGLTAINEHKKNASCVPTYVLAITLVYKICSKYEKTLCSKVKRLFENNSEDDLYKLCGRNGLIFDGIKSVNEYCDVLIEMREKCGKEMRHFNKDEKVIASKVEVK